MIYWSPNIKCSINNGKAYLSEADSERIKCNGDCSECDAFLGVDISHPEMKYQVSCCTRVMLETAVRD